MQTNHSVVSREQWNQARETFLAREKSLTRERDALAQARRDLPWVKVERDYRFTDAKGQHTLASLFEGKSQLIVYHFMFGPDWTEGCVGCSFLVDHLDSAQMHLRHHDVSIVAVSRAAFDKLDAFKHRMGWQVRWLSSLGSDFNADYEASVPRKTDEGTPEIQERSGISVFYRDPDGEIFHTYSAFERGVETLVGAYQYLELAPLGRNERGPNFNLGDWVRHHDRYENQAGPALHACHAA